MNMASALLNWLMDITTLFSVFAPVLVTMMEIKVSIVILSVLTVLFVLNLMVSIMESIFSSELSVSSLFPSALKSISLMSSIFVLLSLLNLLSLTIYSFPVTTTLSFNLGAALSCWICGVLMQSTKVYFVSAYLPSNSPSYLISFLALVEVVSMSVRPLTLSFRLLANMTAGHVLIALICKMSYFWALGSLFGVLELAVATIQAFVFSMLVSVYLEEASTH